MEEQTDEQKLAEFVVQQASSAQKFETSYKNFKKTPIDRRLPELFNETRRRIRTFWNQFVSIDQDIKNNSAYATSEYKTSKYFETVQALRTKYEAKINQFEAEFTKQQQNLQPTTPQQQPSSSQASKTSTTTPRNNLAAAISGDQSSNSTTTCAQVNQKSETNNSNSAAATSSDNLSKSTTTSAQVNLNSEADISAATSGDNLSKSTATSAQANRNSETNNTVKQVSTDQTLAQSPTQISPENNNEAPNSSEMVDFEKEKNKRSLKITQLGELVGKIETFVNENKSIQFLEQKMKQLSVLWTSILDNTETMMNSDKYVKEHQDELSTIQDLYDNAVIQIEEIKSTSTKKRSVKLPQLDIPHFDGNYMAWQSFHDLFEQAVYKDSSISSVEKLQLLKTVLKGEAGQMIKHLQLTEENFAAAWELLKNRYNNERRLVETYVKSMLKQPRISTESAASLKQLHDTTLECVLAIKNLKIDTSGSDFLNNAEVGSGNNSIIRNFID